MLVRLLTDRCDVYDRIEKEYDGSLYVEVTPITFDILVRPGMALSQLRLCQGSEKVAALTREELSYEEECFPVVDREGEPLRGLCEKDQGEIWIPFSLDLSRDSRVGCSAFVAKADERRRNPLDVDGQGRYEPGTYWEPVQAEDGSIPLSTDRLYILRSKERVKIPAHMALECRSYTEYMGEWRIEYAGFAHPFFGESRTEGAPIIFEVRGHNVPTILREGLPLGNVCFRRMSQAAEQVREEGRSETTEAYEQQELQLSKCFRPWPS